MTHIGRVVPEEPKRKCACIEGGMQCAWDDEDIKQTKLLGVGVGVGVCVVFCEKA